MHQCSHVPSCTDGTKHFSQHPTLPNNSVLAEYALTCRCGLVFALRDVLGSLWVLCLPCWESWMLEPLSSNNARRSDGESERRASMSLR